MHNEKLKFIFPFLLNIKLADVFRERDRNSYTFHSFFLILYRLGPFDLNVQTKGCWSYNFFVRLVSGQ
jgi:hypothetical protein